MSQPHAYTLALLCQKTLGVLSLLAPPQTITEAWSPYQDNALRQLQELGDIVHHQAYFHLVSIRLMWPTAAKQLAFMVLTT